MTLTRNLHEWKLKDEKYYVCKSVRRNKMREARRKQNILYCAVSGTCIFRFGCRPAMKLYGKTYFSCHAYTWESDVSFFDSSTNVFGLLLLLYLVRPTSSMCVVSTGSIINNNNNNSSNQQPQQPTRKYMGISKMVHCCCVAWQLRTASVQPRHVIIYCVFETCTVIVTLPLKYHHFYLGTNVYFVFFF